ncbi:Tetratricopeptide repeat protein [compost metagenome]
MLPLGLLLYRHFTLMSLVAPVMLLLASAYSPDAKADWKTLWWTPDQLGQQAMDEGDYKRAAEFFTDDYRKGRAYYLAKDYPQAAAAFRHVRTAEGYFYLANSLAQQQQYQAALKYYRQALLIDPKLAQASSNAQAVKAVLDELAKRPGEREKADPDSTDFTSIQIDLRASRNREQEKTSAARAMSEDELNNWMANVKSSPRDMLKALFLLQTQDRYLREEQ